MSEVMRPINLIVVHCSATREDKDFTEYDLDVCHRRRGFNGAGYHFYIRKNGDVCTGCSRHCRLEKEKRECGNTEKKK